MPAASQPNEPPHRFSADRPLELMSEDKLERIGFAGRLAGDIHGWHGKDSLVVSLNGAWGSGKTTLKNFVKESLEKRGHPIVVEFNPWAWSGQERLLEGFFGAIHAKFKKTDTDAETKQLAERWESLESWTKLGAEISDQVSKALAPLFGGSVTVALLANTAPNSWVRTGGIVIGLLGVLVSTFFAVFPGIAGRYVEALKVKSGHGQRTLAQLRGEITAELGKLRDKKRPVVVIIDDIDRLNAEEIRLLFQLVKVNADFPNLVYLLLFQKNIVTDALAKVTADSGEEYLKKIVQVEFDVPHASRGLMLTIFQDGLNQILDTERIKMRWDKDRIADLFEDDLWPYFQTLRDVKRFLGTFDFYFNGQVNHGVLEVNPVDLLAIEVLRTFDHETYLAIRDALGYSFRGSLARLLFGAEERKKRVTVEIDAIVNRPGLGEPQKGRLRAVLRALFPDDHDGEFMAKAERDLRICHPAHFGKYFEHSLDETATSAASIQALLQLVGQREKFAVRLLEVCRSGEVEEVLKKVRLYFEDIPASAAESFIGALFDVGDELPKAKMDLLNRELTFEAARMCYWLLQKLPDSATRKLVLERTLATTKGVVVPVVVIGILLPPRERKEERPQLLEPADLAPLQQVVLARIRAMAASGAIWQRQHFQLFLYRWRDWAGLEEVNAWLREALHTPQRKLEFLTFMLSESIVNGHKLEYFLSAKSLEEFVNLETLAQDVANAPIAESDKLASLARTLLTRALRLKAAGHQYGEVRERGDFEPED
jgi:predicted KAP-like P-loop ATPase